MAQGTVYIVKVSWVFSFSPQVDEIFLELKKAKPSKRIHICLFSATLPPSVVLLAETIVHGAVHLSVGKLLECRLEALWLEKWEARLK